LDFNDSNGQKLSIVGDEFMKNWYTVFNYDGPGGPRVGFGKIVE